MTKEVLNAMTGKNDEGSDIMEKLWDIREMPDFKGRKFYALGGAFFGSVVKLMVECGFVRAKSMEEADLVVFVGGSDVWPGMYNQKAIAATSYHKGRDEEEKLAYEYCRQAGKPMFGICRGAQFLWVMNGGELWQHVNGHGGVDHWIYDTDEDLYVLSNSYHHQMCALNPATMKTAEILAVCKDQVSKQFYSDTMEIDLTKEGANTQVEIEIEAGYFIGTKCFFVQGHPEVGDPEYKSWCMTKLHEMLLEWEETSFDVDGQPATDEEIDRPGDGEVESQFEAWEMAFCKAGNDC